MPDVDDGFAWILVTLLIFFPEQEARLKTSSNVFYSRTNFRECTVLLHTDMYDVHWAILDHFYKDF